MTNILGMTNRPDLIDDALKRPGRLEVHKEIGLPNRDGRRQILDIHTEKMRKKFKKKKEKERPVSSLFSRRSN